MSAIQRTECKGCGQHIEFPAELAGQEITCPSCGARLKGAQEENKNVPPKQTITPTPPQRTIQSEQAWLSKAAIALLALAVVTGIGVYANLSRLDSSLSRLDSNLGRIEGELRKLGESKPLQIKPTEAWDYSFQTFRLVGNSDVADAELWWARVKLEGQGNDGWECVGTLCDQATRTGALILKKPKTRAAFSGYAELQQKQELEAYEKVLEAIRKQ